jgi:hypothetical protein
MDLKIVSIFFFYSILDIMSLEFKVFDPWMIVESLWKPPWDTFTK